MSARAWYARYGADFVHGTMGLTLEEKGAYSICLDLIYDRGGPIPDDPRWLAGVCGVSIRKWNALRQRLLEIGKLVLREAGISNLRAELELENAAKLSRKHAENGAKGGDKSAENRTALSKNNDLATARLKHRARVLQPQDKTEREDAAPPPDGGVALPPSLDPPVCPDSSSTGGPTPTQKGAADAIGETVRRAKAEAVLSDPQTTPEERFWALKFRVSEAGVNWSMAMKLAKQSGGDYPTVVRAVERALGMRDPTGYLGKVLSELRRDAEPDAPSQQRSSKSREPGWVADTRGDGESVQSDGPNRWRWRGCLYDDQQNEIGW